MCPGAQGPLSVLALPPRSDPGLLPTAHLQDPDSWKGGRCPASACRRKAPVAVFLRGRCASENFALLSPLSPCSARLPVSSRHRRGRLPRGAPARPRAHRVQHLPGCSAPAANPGLRRVSGAASRRASLHQRPPVCARMLVLTTSPEPPQHAARRACRGAPCKEY